MNKASANLGEEKLKQRSEERQQKRIEQRIRVQELMEKAAEPIVFGSRKNFTPERKFVKTFSNNRSKIGYFLRSWH